MVKLIYENVLNTKLMDELQAIDKLVTIVQDLEHGTMRIPIFSMTDKDGCTLKFKDYTQTPIVDEKTEEITGYEYSEGFAEIKQIIDDVVAVHDPTPYPPTEETVQITVSEYEYLKDYDNRLDAIELTILESEGVTSG